jgi:hypothetical protein
VVLILVSGLAVYERMYALPASERAHTMIDEAAGERLLSAREPLSSDDVQQLLGKKPAETVTEGDAYMEKYVWRRGLPWRTYYMWVVYTPTKKYQMHFSNEDPGAIAQIEDVPGWDDHEYEAAPALDVVTGQRQVVPDDEEDGATEDVAPPGEDESRDGDE